MLLAGYIWRVWHALTDVAAGYESMKTKRERKLAERIRRLQSDPCNARIPRVEQAGRIVGGHLVTHNGLRVQPMDACYMELLQANGGCHEPQEEWVFKQVLERIPRGGSIVELGAYWGFYSMWFASQVPDAKCLLVEPRAEHLEVGKYNFAHNGFHGQFFQGLIGRGHVALDEFIAEHRLSHIDVLHADIQGAEFEMLCDAESLLSAGRIGYLFVGTHSQDLHYRCLRHLKSRGYEIIANADFRDGTFCEDGVLVARLKSLDGVGPVDLPQRRAHRPYVLNSHPPGTLRHWLRASAESLFQSRKSA